MSTRGWKPSTHREAGRQGFVGGSWRQRGSVATSSSSSEPKNESVRELDPGKKGSTSEHRTRGRQNFSQQVRPTHCTFNFGLTPTSQLIDVQSYLFLLQVIRLTCIQLPTPMNRGTTLLLEAKFKHLQTPFSSRTHPFRDWTARLLCNLLACISHWG